MLALATYSRMTLEMLETLSIRTNPCKSMHVIASSLPPCGESAAAALTAAALEAAPSAFAAVADAVAAMLLWLLLLWLLLLLLLLLL